MPRIRIKTSLQKGSFKLKTLDDFMLPGFEFEDFDYYSDSEKRRELVRFFCAGAGLSRQGDALLDLLDVLEQGRAPEKKVCAGMKKFGALFEGIGDGAYLGVGGYRAYLPAADAAAQKVDSSYQMAAWAHIFLYSMILRTPFDHLGENVQRALLAGFHHPQTFVVPSMDVRKEIFIGAEGMEFAFRWDNLPDAPLTACRLVNPNKDRRVVFHLNTPIGRRSVMLPAGGMMNTFFVGDVVTCLKGNIQLRRNIAMSRSAGGSLQRLDVRSGQCSKIDAPVGAPDDFAMGSYNHLFILRKDTLSTPDQERIEGAIGIFAADDCWVAVMKDGTTQSGKLEFCMQDVIAVVQDGAGLSIVVRGNEIERYAALMHTMLDRFDTGSADCAEQLSVGKGRICLMANNFLEWRNKG